MRFTIKDYSTETYEKQNKTAFLALMAELPNFIASLVACLISKTLIVWMDFFNSFQSTLHYCIVWIAAGKMKSDMSDKYNYGVGRIDVFTSFVCDIIIIVGIIGFSVLSLINIFYPSAPSDNIILFIILKIINIGFDIYFVIQQIKIRKKSQSRLNDTEFANCLKYLIDDCITMLVAVVCLIFKDFKAAWYISPVACLILSAYFLVGCIKRLKKSLSDLTDKALPIETQDEIMQIMISNRTHVKRIFSVNCHELNGITHIDLYVSFDDDTTYKQELDILDTVRCEIHKTLPNSKVSFVICSVSA